MTDSTISPSPGGFVERIQNETLAEVQRILGDLERLQFRADEVARVLRALSLPVPPELRQLSPLERVPGPVTPEPAAPVAAPEAPPAPPEVPPAPEAPPEKREGPVAAALESRSRIESAIRAIAEEHAGHIMPQPMFISARVGVSAPTVKSILERLAAEGWLERVGTDYIRRAPAEPEPKAAEPAPQPAPAPVPAPKPAAPAAPTETSGRPPQHAAIIDLFRENPAARWTAQVVGEKLGTSSESIRKGLNILVGEGVLVKHPGISGRGHKTVAYSLADASSPVPPPPSPGGTEIPEELRDMPVMRGRDRITESNLRGQAIATARGQKQVADIFAADDGNDFTVAELAKRTGIQQSTVGSYIRDLSRAGMVRLTGRSRNQSPVYAKGNGEQFVEALPDALADMPAAETDLAFANQYTIASGQREVLDAARRLGTRTLVVSEIDPFVDMPRTRAKEYLDALAEQGKYLRRTGRYRRAKNQRAGRTAVEYELVGPSPKTPTAPTTPKSDVPKPTEKPTENHRYRHTVGHIQPTEKPTENQQETLNNLRTEMRRQEGERLSAEFLADRVNAPIAVVTRLLEALVASSGGSVTAVGEGAARRYIFERSSDPGAAAKVDQQRRKAPGRTGSGAAPVPGTGRGPKAAHAEVQNLLNAAMRIVGRENVIQSGGHWSIKCPNGERVLISSTPSNPKSLLQDRARLRRIGGLDI